MSDFSRASSDLLDVLWRVVTVRAMASITPQKLLTYDDLAEITGYSVDHLRHLKMVGDFPATCGPGRRVLVHPADLQLWLDRNRKAA